MLFSHAKRKKHCQCVLIEKTQSQGRRYYLLVFFVCWHNNLSHISLTFFQPACIKSAFGGIRRSFQTAEEVGCFRLRDSRVRRIVKAQTRKKGEETGEKSYLTSTETRNLTSPRLRRRKNLHEINPARVRIPSQFYCCH